VGGRWVPPPGGGGWRGRELFLERGNIRLCRFSYWCPRSSFKPLGRRDPGTAHSLRNALDSSTKSHYPRPLGSSPTATSQDPAVDVLHRLGSLDEPGLRWAQFGGEARGRWGRSPVAGDTAHATGRLPGSFYVKRRWCRSGKISVSPGTVPCADRPLEVAALNLQEVAQVPILGPKGPIANPCRGRHEASWATLSVGECAEW
jgi:hypothetical protein